MLSDSRKRHSRSSSSRSSYLFSLLLIISSAIQFTNAVKCYFTDGTAADSTFQPCDTTKEFSACCATNKLPGLEPDICLGSGLCYAQQPGYNGQIYQNSCTDQSWSSSDCPHVCPGFSSDDAIQVVPCPQSGRGDWCCASNSQDSCCDDSFPLNVGTLMVSSASTTTATTATTATSCPTVTSTIAPLETAPSNNNSTNADCSERIGGPDPTAIGVGVGVSLGACLLMALAALWWQGRSYRRKLRDATAASSPVAGELYSKHGFYEPSIHQTMGVPVAEAPAPPAPVYEVSADQRMQA